MYVFHSNFLNVCFSFFHLSGRPQLAMLQAHPKLPRILQPPHILRTHTCLCRIIIVHTVSHAVISTAHASNHEHSAFKQSSKEHSGIGGTIKGTKRVSVDGGPE